MDFNMQLRPRFFPLTALPPRRKPPLGQKFQNVLENVAQKPKFNLQLPVHEKLKIAQKFIKRETPKVLSPKIASAASSTPPLKPETVPNLETEKKPIKVAAAPRRSKNAKTSQKIKDMCLFQIPEPEALNPHPWMKDPSIPPPNLKLRVLSIVASVRLGCPLDLKHLAAVTTQVHYNPDCFTPLKLVIQEPYAVGMIFASGSMIVNGTTTIQQCATATQKLGIIISACGFPVMAKPVMQIQNITATVNLKFRIKLNKLMTCEQLKGRMFPRENFSGLTIEMTAPRAKIILFQTGRALITGVTTEEEVQEALHFIYPFAKMYSR